MIPDIQDASQLTLQEAPAGSAWFVVHARPRCEKKIVAFCDRNDIPVYLPLRNKVHRYGGRRRAFSSPLFPGYAFCILNDRTRTSMGQNRYVANLLHVLEQEKLVVQLRQIQRALEIDDTLEVMPYLKKGRHVQVTAGPFKGLEGIVQRIKGRTRVVLNVDMIQQGVAVEVDMAWLAPA